MLHTTTAITSVITSSKLRTVGLRYDTIRYDAVCLRALKS